MVNSDLLDIDYTRDVIIISHPRSGSSWLQSCFPHVNCFEPFSRFATVNFNGNNVTFDQNKQSKKYAEGEYVAMVADRIFELSRITSPKSVKVHSFFLNTPRMIDWINSQDATVVFLERRDKLKAFKSLIISYTLNTWVGPITKSSVTADMNVVVELYKRIFDPHVDWNKTKLKHQFQTVYYEDLILENKLVSSNPPFIKQNTTDVVIENWDQIHDHLVSNKLI